MVLGLFWVGLGGGGRHYESEVSILDFWSVFGSPDSQFLNVRVMWRGGGFKIIFWPLFTLLVMPKSARNGGERYTVVALERVEAHTWLTTSFHEKRPILRRLHWRHVSIGYKFRPKNTWILGDGYARSFLWMHLSVSRHTTSAVGPPLHLSKRARSHPLVSPLEFTCPPLLAGPYPRFGGNLLRLSGLNGGYF